MGTKPKRISGKGGQTGRQIPTGKRATIKTISELTGLSPSTVSLSLRGGTALKEETRERVLEVARQIGYVPDRAGVRLRTGKTNVIALVLGSGGYSVDFARHLIAGIGKGIAETNYHLTILPEIEGDDPLASVRYILENRTADGVIITHTAPRDRRVQMLMEAEFPFVSHGRTEFYTPHAYHDFHSERFAELAVGRLAQLGCQRILLSQSDAETMNYTNILTAYLRACAQAGIVGDLHEDKAVTSRNLDEVRSFGRELARSPSRPDGIICTGELYAIALFGGLQEEGIAIGRDIKLVCKQTSDLLSIVYPQSDGIEEDVFATGMELARLMLERVGGKSREELQTLLEPVVRWRYRPEEGLS